MGATTARKTPTAEPQEICIDLPGEAVQCWRSSDNIKVILRKHREVFFDINLKKGASYTVESASDFYSPRERKLLRNITFQDGERCHLWVGREFQSELVLKANGRVLGAFEVHQLDTKSYGADPKNKPEPLMVIMGRGETVDPFICRADDLFGFVETQQMFKISFDEKLSILRHFGTEYDYRHPVEPPHVEEYVVVTEALPHEIQPHILQRLDHEGWVSGTADQILTGPNEFEPSTLNTAIGTAVRYMSGNEFLNSSSLKEAAGYLQENFRSLNKLGMTVRVEKKIKGKHKVLFKGRPLAQRIGQAIGVTKAVKTVHETVTLGSKGSAFIDGGFPKKGKHGYGGVRRILMTTANNFRAGMKIQIIGTVIDIVVDIDSVFYDEKGSGELSELLVRAGITVAKAGATAAAGSLFASILGAGVIATGAPVAIAVAAVVGGYVLAAYLVDSIDKGFELKERAARAAR